MWGGACVRACVWTLACVSVVGTTSVDYDYNSETGNLSYTDDYPEVNTTIDYKPWNYLIKLLGIDTSEPWKDKGLQVEGLTNFTSDALRGLSDSDIWNEVTNGDEIMMNDDAGSRGDESDAVATLKNIEERSHDEDLQSSSGTQQSKRSLDKHAEEKVLDGLLQGDSAGPRDAKGSSTLAFVFDTTGSMWDDLVQVRHGAAKIMETMLERPDRPIADYVLVPFHDPLIGPVTVTTDHKLLMQKLNEIQIYGGGDCPEASVEAVLQALQLSRPNSYIYVFTDARAKDYHLVHQVLPLIQRKQSQVVFVMTGDCGDQTHPGYQVYHKIAATSSGQVYHLNKTDVDEVLSFVRVSLQSRKVNLLSVERPPAQRPADLPLPIDQSLKEFTVSVSGSNASIGVVDPGGQTVQAPQLTPLLDLQNVKVVNVKEPPPGMWTLQVGSDSQHTVRSTGLSGSDFVHGFSVIPTTNMAETYHRPLQSGYNSVLIRATEPDALFNLTTLELVLLNGTVVQTIPLCAVPDHPGLYSGGPFIPPNEFFYLGVHGFGKDNFPVKRITATAISAQPPELPTVSITTSYEGQIGRPLTLICRVESLVPFVVRWYKDGSIKTKAVTYNQTAEVPLEIESVKKTDAGRYICKVHIPNIPGTVFKDTRVKVTGPPPVVVTPAEVTARIGAPAELTCNVISDMPYNVSWYRLNTRASAGSRGQAALDLLSGSPRMVISPNNSLMLMSPDLPDEGWYICTAHNQGGQASGRVHLSLQQAPVVRVTPAHHEYTVGSSVHLHCQVVAGIPYPAVSWTKDHHLVQGDDEPNDNTQWTLRLRNLQKEDEGVYNCEAKNVVGSAQGSAELTLLEAPAVKAELGSQLVMLGDSVTLRCHTEGAPPPQLTWYKDQSLLSSETHPRMQILKNGVLEIYNTSPEDSGRYMCVARNKVGTAKDFVDLEIGSAPRVVHLPSDLAVPIGGSASVLCAAIGNPVPVVTWSRVGKPLQPSRMFTSEQGELFIREAEKDDEGEYTCTVENTFGKSIYNISVKITGIVAPRLMPGSLPVKTKALLGRSVQLYCPVLAGNPPPTRQWLKDGVPLDSSYYRIGSDGSLLLSNVSSVDRGSYECVVTNVGGRDSLATTVDVMVPPRIAVTEQDAEVRAVEGSPVTLTCPVTGDPPPSVTWLRHGRRLSASGQNGTSLQLPNITIQQSGTYTCLALSPAGSDSTSTLLHVLVPPKINQWKENVTVNEGHHARLECHVTSNPPSNISWYFERTLLPYHSSVIRFSANKTAEGQYKCVAENEVGSTTKLVNLFVSVVPRIDPLTPTKLTGVAGEEVRLTCPATGDPRPVVTWSKMGIPITRQVNEEGTVVLTELTPADAGTYVCAATNTAGSAVLPVSLDVLVRPVIVGWEGEVSVLEGETLGVVCEVEGEPSPDVTWLRDGQHHADRATLKFTARREDAGLYSCVAENEVGVDKQNLSLIVIVPAQIVGSEEETARLYGNGSETRLECVVDGVPTPTVSWLKDSVPVSSTDKHIRYTSVREVEGNVLIISNATKESAGMYICQAENVAGIAQKIFETEFYEPPRILETGPTMITLREGDDYTIPCTATGIPTPRVSWRFGKRESEELVVMKDKLLVLIQVTAASQGEYQCVAESEAGLAHRNYTIQVIVPPAAMDSSVTRVEIVESNSGELTCPVQGSPDPTIQWLKDGKSVLNERADDSNYILKNGSRTLKIVEASPEDGGLYTCIATNLAGRSQAMFDVDVLTHPHFLDEFAEKDFVKTEGERVEFDCRVDGNPDPKVSWKRVEQNLPVSQHTSPGVMVELPHRRRLVIPSARPHHAGTYLCTAANQLGRESRTFSLRVSAPPELDGAKEEVIDTVPGQRLALQCRVWGTPDPAVTWEYSDSDTSNFQKIESEGDDVWVLERQAQPGLYKCTATNPLGTVSKLFNVTVSEPPAIAGSEVAEELRLRLGSDGVLTCNVTGQPPPSVTWLHNGHVLPHSQGPRLALGPATLLTGGKYACVASNKAGVADKTFKVKVLVPPRISEPLHFSADPRVAVVEGLPLTLRCPVTGTPSPAIAWLKDGTAREGVGETLSVIAIKREDAGNYTCIATNHAGNVSKTFIVIVHSAPQFLAPEPAPHVEVLSKASLRLNCPVSASPPPSVMWLLGSDPVTSPVSLSNNNQTLIIDSVGLEHSGLYSCIASNIAGTAERTFDVNVLEPPSVMGDEAVGNTSSAATATTVVLHRKVVLECPVSGTPQPNISWYKDGESLVGYETSMDGRLLHIMNALVRHGGNYSCRAENQAGVTQLFMPLTVIVPHQWTEWSDWTPCSKSCGGGKESRERQCGHDTNTSSPFVLFDASDCVADRVQSRPCNVLPCQVDGGWGQWTAWTSCSESCGPGTRRRYRRCDSPAPALGGDPCLGSDGQQEPCIMQSCPLHSQWSEWTAWSACTAKCGVGTKFRARQCVRGDEVAEDCDGSKQEVMKCSNRKCPVDGKWSTWGPWSSCSVSCGRGLRQRHRLCSRRLYGGKPCFGDNIEIEKCLMEECEPSSAVTTRASGPESASLRIRGQVNGRLVDDVRLDARIQRDGPKRRVTATLKDILKDQASWYPYLTFLIPPLTMNPATQKDQPTVGYDLNNGNFTEESRYQFATGQELTVKHVGKGMDKKGAFRVDIEVEGEVPVLQPTSAVVLDPYSEDYVKTSPNSMYTSSRSAMEVDGEKVPFKWNRTVVFDSSRDTVPYLVERLSTDEVASKYNPERDELEFEVSSKVGKKHHNNKCPIGFKLDPQYHHCTDIDECKEIKRPCRPSQMCENQFGSYRCHCQAGFRLSPGGAKCVDINECVEQKPCSHNCHNTKGSFYCSCPPQLALSHSGLTCKAWGELDMEESDEEEYVEDDVSSNYQYLEAPAETTTTCKPGLVWRNNNCIDIDECIDEEACGEEETCMNTQGSFHCLKTPCINSYWDHDTRSCVKVCEEWREGCDGEAEVAEVVQHVPLTLASATLAPYQELATLRPLGLQDEPLTSNVFDITDNEQDVPLRIRIENGQGILYAMKYFEINGIYRITVKASSYSKDYKTELYTTHFVVFLYAESN